MKNSKKRMAMKIKLKMMLFKQKVIESIKYDYNWCKFPLVLFAYILIYAYIFFGNKLKAFNISSVIYRTGWCGSYGLGLHFARYFFYNKERANTLTVAAIDSIQPLSNTAQFFDHPENMLDGIITVLKSANKDEKGVLILNYSYYFLMFHKYFNVERILENYIVVLEPSWAGFCETSILSYANVSSDVYLMCYEKRDLNFINELNTKIKPIEIGPSWFVNHKNFQVSSSERDIDIIMVAAWAKFKRHGAFFKAISKLKNNGISPRIVLVGYPVDTDKETILQLADRYGVSDWLTIYESITHKEVAALLNRSKVNVLWSKFEGNNRAIIEGMFCNTVVIMRKGHNYGEHYDFINEKTGMFAGESDLADSVLKVLNSYGSFSPRKYVLDKRSCIAATEILNKVISNDERLSGREWTNDLVVKVNELHNMDYLDLTVREKFKQDYAYLLELLKKNED